MAKVDVILPQMGESIAEGTVTRWLKKVGDKVKRDEPLFEISTDKVDAEIPAPRGGTLVEIKVKEGQTAPVKTVVAIIETEAGAGKPVEEVAKKPEPTPPKAALSREMVAALKASHKAAAVSAGERRLQNSSPLVRKIAEEHGVDISQIPGTGLSGRVTKDDILKFIEAGGTQRREERVEARREVKASAISPPQIEVHLAGPRWTGDARVHRKPMSTMRKKIAEHMVMSKRTSAHVSSVFEVDVTNIVKLREKMKDKFFETHGTKLSFMPFFFQATVKGLQQVPILNASVAGEEIIFHRDINLGIAVALDWGLIVPVIKRAEELSMVGLARAANDLADRARTKKLQPDEVQGGTFTITNPGVFGSLFGIPIINQPQVGILDIGGIEKRQVVFNDAIAIRHMVYLGISFDHRIVDGADADNFMSVVKDHLQTANFSPLL
ncbi:MAG TPA: dihydrolipoamide acetyltransferase family protein [Bdellovibrionota bacterium]|nr:dihydrolipoamide acetyltransferase family protein [Bdellovibrionota bacterium]